jgi:muramidase (phage lysozyme)
MNERQFLEKFRQTPEGQRLLKTIRFAEGTAGPKGYQTMFGGGTFSDLSRHPDRVIRSGGYASAAAGAYQFLPGTWQSQSSRLGLKGFGPAEQDVAALALARNRLMGIGGLATLQKEGLSPRVAAALAPEWASFPTEAGVSYYGQPVKSLSSLQKYYGNAAVAPAPQQVATPALAANPDIDIQALTTALRKKKSTSLLDSFKTGLVDQLIRQTNPGNLNFLGTPLFGSTGLF